MVVIAFLAMAVVAFRNMSATEDARLFGVVFLAGVFACLLMMGATWLLARRDRSGREDAGDALAAIENLNSRMIEGSIEGIAVLDEFGRLKSVNSAAWSWFEEVGISPTENLNWIDIWDGDPRAAAEASLLAATNGSLGRFQALCHVRSGEGRWYDVTLTPVRERLGKVDRIMVVSRDITAAQSAEEKFQALFDHAADAHIIFEGEQILDCNHAAVEMLRFPTKTEMIGMGADVFSPDCQPDGSTSCEKRRELWQLAREMGHFRHEWQARRSNGEEFPIEVALTPISVDGREALLAVWSDLTERRLAERALRESEQRFQAFMDHSPTLCFIKDDRGRMMFINRVMAEGYGVTVDEMVGKTDFDWLPFETAREVTEYDRRVLLTNRPAQQIEIVTDGEGRTREWLVVKFPIATSSGRTFLGGIGVDIREQRRAERALKESEAAFRDLFDDAPVAYHELDTEGRMVRVNKTELALLGYSAEEMVGRHVWDFCVEKISREVVAEKLKGGGNTGEAFQRHYRRKDGTVIPVLVRDRLIRNSSGEVCGIRSTMQDISTLKQTEESLRAAEENYRKIFENAIEGIFQIHPEGRYLNANPALTAILGYASPAELIEQVTDIGRQVYVAPNRFSEFCALMERNESITGFESEVFRMDGSIIWVCEHARAIRDENGRLLYYEGAMEDIMARREAERAMAEARDAAIESARLKTEFLANMSHEIRTPMNGIIGMTGLLLDTDLSVRQKDFAETIAESSEALLKIINDILDFSKIEAGMVVFEEIDFDVNEVVEGVVDLFAERAMSKGIELSVVISQGVSEILRGDPGRLRQVLTNLVGNALKFTEEGEVRVSVHAGTDSPKEAQLRFEIEDTGIGISQEQQARLFQAFVQADGSTTRRYGGSGLGLAICKRLVTQMGGEIALDSEPGRGSRFSFTAAFRKPASVADRRTRRFDGMRALVIDDNPTVRAAIAHSLEPWGVAIAEAPGAEDAMRTLEDAASEGRMFDVVFFDTDLRSAAGDGIACSIRSDARFAGVRIVRIASLDWAEDNVEDGKADGLLIKPIKQKAALRCLEAVIASEETPVPISVESSATSSAATLQRDRASLRVLVAEDSMVNQKVVLFQLRKLGCDVDSVTDGESAVSAARTGNYDVILMDCQMPRLDGIESTRQIREFEAMGTRRAWIIAMTAHSMVGDREICIEAGMDDYLGKPVRMRELEEALARCPARRADDETEEEPDWATVVSHATLASFRELEEECGQSILEAVIDLFFETTPPVFQEARCALGRDDAASLARLAHTLKGSCSNFGARRMREACAQLEALALGGSLDGAGPLLEQMEKEFGYVRTALENELSAKIA